MPALPLRAHEVADPFRSFRPNTLARPQPRGELAVVHCFSPERGFREAGFGGKCLNLSQQVLRFVFHGADDNGQFPIRQCVKAHSLPLSAVGNIP